MSLMWLGWLAAGILAYGFIKGRHRSIGEQFYQEYQRGDYLDIDEISCWVFFVFGYLGLLTCLLLHVVFQWRLRLCFFMPKQLCHMGTNE